MMNWEVVFEPHSSLVLMIRLFFASGFFGQHWPLNAPDLLP